ncbi:hypothetical protein JHK85_010830 [Glycine max]|nr:hypothetical protein JHK85_010830 [Glycine max]KAG5066808.1 hypothetical protein JHK86_010539 [Glycine max]
MVDALSLIPTVVLCNLADKLYEKHKYVALDVYMDREIKSGEIVALKKIRMDNEREGIESNIVQCPDPEYPKKMISTIDVV